MSSHLIFLKNVKFGPETTENGKKTLQWATPENPLINPSFGPKTLDGPAHGVRIHRIVLILQYNSSKLAGSAGYWEIWTRSNKIERQGGGHLGLLLHRACAVEALQRYFDNLGLVLLCFCCYCKHKIDYLAVSSNQMSTNSASISINLEINHTKHKN